MDALTTVQTLCEASTTPHRAAATCAKAMLGVINNQDEIRADETLRASAQDACIALVHSCRGASRWGALRALSVLGLCSAGQTLNLSVALVRNDEALDPRALRVLVAVLPAESGAEHAFLDFCLSTSKAHLTEAVRQLLELRNDQDAGGAANLAMRLFKSGFLDLLASDQTDDAQENVARAETVSLLLSALGFWWKSSKTSFATDQVPRSFDVDFLVDTVLALPVKASSAALCCGVLALHIGFSAQDRSDKDFAFMEDQTSFSQIVRKIFERLRKISVAESESSEASQESLELWLWPLLCLLRTLASLDAPAAAAIAVGLPFSSRLPLHVQHWACAALSLTTRPRGQVQEWALKISRNETWFSGTERDARALASAALSARHFCIATGLEIAFPHTVLAPETWLAAFAQNEELQAHTSVEMLGLLAILSFKGGVRTKLVFPLAMLTKEVPWQLRAAHLILIASLGTQAQLPSWDPIISALFDSPHVQVREAACACACQCRPKDEAMRFGVLTNSASPWARVICLTSPQDGWTHFVKRALDPPLELESVSASFAKHARPQFVIVPGVLSESFDLLLQWYPQHE